MLQLKKTNILVLNELFVLSAALVNGSQKSRDKTINKMAFQRNYVLIFNFFTFKSKVRLLKIP